MDHCWRASTVLWSCYYIQIFLGARIIVLVNYHLQTLALLIFLIIFVGVGFFLLLPYNVIYAVIIIIYVLFPFFFS